MCGRYTLVNLKAFVDALPHPVLFDAAADSPPRYNIAPTQESPVVVFRPPSQPGLPAPWRLERARWGLVPSWATEPSIGQRLINARSETVAEKPAFRDALKRRRCLVPADGFYEWTGRGEQGRAEPRPRDGAASASARRQPYYLRLRGGVPFAFAGLWEIWRPRDDPHAPPLVSYTLLTTTPNELVRPLHDRMPVILHPDHYRTWLESTDLDRVLGLLRPYDPDAMEAYPVTPRVGNPRHDDPTNILPLT